MRLLRLKRTSILKLFIILNIIDVCYGEGESQTEHWKSSCGNLSRILDKETGNAKGFFYLKIERSSKKVEFGRYLFVDKKCKGTPDLVMGYKGRFRSSTQGEISTVQVNADFKHLVHPNSMKLYSFGAVEASFFDFYPHCGKVCFSSSMENTFIVNFNITKNTDNILRVESNHPNFPISSDMRKQRLNWVYDK